MSKLRSVLLLIVLLASCSILAQQQEGDRIVAIVGNDIITESDLRAQIIQYAKQNNITEINETVMSTVFQNMIFDKMILAKADQDSITATDDEVQKQLDYQIKGLIDKFGSEKNLEEAFGGTLNKLKQIYRQQIKDRIKIDKVKQAKFGSGLGITKTEVRKFYEAYKDSLPPVPETYELYQIVRVPKLTDEAKKTAKDKALQLLDSVKNGADFSELAKKYSDDSGSAVNGGDLGYSKKGAFVKPFEDAAFLLKPGEVSDIVETEFGYHILKLIDKKGDQIRVQHILVKYPHSESADFEEINFLKDLRTKVQKGEGTFKQFAALYSQEKESAADSGYAGKIAVTSLDSSEVIELSKFNEGEITDPVRVGDNRNYAYNIYLIKKRIPEHKISYDTDYDVIEKYALNMKEQKVQAEWFEELRKSIYLETKI